MADDDLLRQLGSLEAACRSLSTDGSSSLCLFRLVEGLSPESWRELQRKHELHAWQAARPAEVASGLGELVEDATQALLLRFLACEMDRARHCQQPLALALVEPEAPGALDTVFELARAQLRSFDHAARLSPGPVAVVLSGTPLASAERQLGAMLRRIRQVSEPNLVCSAGLVGYGGLVELAPRALLARAEAALAEARRLGGNRLEVAPSADAVLASRESLVRASEKHFLFTGKKLTEK